ncbi:MAG: SDR family oxidoreductase [Dehalococcoidales bacterium]|nr:SDR family oxidoreductase [Dehalococcoidales bacterium]
MADRLKGRVAIVTGSGGGIGRGEALALAAEGAKVVINDVGAAVTGAGGSGKPADTVVDEIKKMGGEAVANYDSVSTPEGGENIIKTALNAFGKLDILVNNAGILRDKMVFNMTNEEWDAVIKVHLYGHFYTARAACVLFRQQKSGRIINTSSTSGLGNRGQSNYAAAKEGIIGFTRTLALEMGKYGVTVNAIRPNAGTRMTISDDMKQAAERTGRTGMIQYMESLKPEDVAPMVVWLASDAAANVNGRNFFVQSGRIALFSEPVQEKVIMKRGGFTTDELFAMLPTTLTQGLINPAPKEVEAPKP